MAEVSFYILPSASLAERDLFACKLIEKAYRSGSFCYVLTDTAEQSHHLDDLLWTFRAGSFIPHQIYNGILPELEQVILIGSLMPPEGWQKTLFNLSSHFPDASQHSERILEILDNNETTKASGRDRYRRYQALGMDITTHKLDLSAVTSR
ncbi:MAG: DNA polymerase III subunit chi [Methylococcaceae bacterium]|nr:DNA polymerase III subunit chi [Methylococcaceae bacterium]